MPSWTEAHSVGAFPSDVEQVLEPRSAAESAEELPLPDGVAQATENSAAACTAGYGPNLLAAFRAQALLDRKAAEPNLSVRSEPHAVPHPAG